MKIAHLLAARLLAACLLIAGFAGPAARASDAWHNFDVTGSSLPLDLSMTRANDGKQVTQADYRGDVVLLYFGYTYCPDVCPLTLSNLVHVADQLGPLEPKVKILFVTVDPDRDTLSQLKQYAAAFGPQVEALRGSQDALATLAQRYRIAYSVKHDAQGNIDVTHSSAVYAFDGTGAARLLIPSMASTTPDITGTAADLRRLLTEDAQSGWLSRTKLFLHAVEAKI